MIDDSLPNLAQAQWLRDTTVQRILGALNGAGGETRIVGGAVRNALLGQSVADIDLATALSPDTVIERVEKSGMKAVPTGIAHGTVTVVVGGRPFEVTTLRRDVATDGRHATVAFTDDWAQDASRRDFTINALYLNMDGTLFDPLGGAADIRERRVRFIGDPAARIAEDYLRILRFFRISAAFSDTLDETGLRACVRARSGLLTLSAERVHQEMLKLLGTARPLQAVIALCETGLFSLLLAGVPHVAPFERYLQIETRHSIAGDALRRLCILACLIEEDVERLQQRLRLSRAQHARLVQAVSGYRRVRAFMSERDAKAGIYHAGPEVWCDRVALAWCRASAANDHRWRDLYGVPARWRAPALPWTGNTLARQGIGQGPAVGRLLKQLEALWIAADFPSDARDQEVILAEALEKFAN